MTSESLPTGNLLIECRGRVTTCTEPWTFPNQTEMSDADRAICKARYKNSCIQSIDYCYHQTYIIYKKYQYSYIH